MLYDSHEEVQGDHSGCTLGVIDLKTKVVFYKEQILKLNLCIDVNQT